MVLSQAAVINAYKPLSVQGHRNLEEFIVQAKHPICLSCSFFFLEHAPLFTAKDKVLG